MKTKSSHSPARLSRLAKLCPKSLSLHGGGLVALVSLLLCGTASAQSPVFSPAVDIDQTQLLAKGYPLQKVLESGGQFWTTPYTVADGFGEGAKGPRAAQRAAMYPNNPTFPFLRVNGIDSQSCYECHNSIGSYVPAGSSSGALIRRPGTVGGSAGFNSDAFINELFPTPLTLFVRNPPHVFGVGYVQQLAYEMTLDLLATEAIVQAKAKANPGVPQSMTLQSKGTSFGTYSTTWDATTQTFSKATGFVGVSDDLTVRPLQWKGIASSVRHFVRDALDFHFSMQAVEKVGTNASGQPNDLDADGVVNEVTVGNVSAMTAFVGMTRPPTQDIPAGQEKQVALGTELFSGKGSPSIPSGNMMCATCHTPSLHLNHATLIIETPEIPVTEPPPGKGKIPSLTDPEADRSKLAVHRIFAGLQKAAGEKLKAEPGKNPQALYEAVRTPLSKALDQTYLVDLTNPDLGSPTSYALPRLPANPDTSVDVPLFSDLKRHDMGIGLSDPNKRPDGTSYPEQGTDVMGISVPAQLFLTRPLWGVADTGPWLHDGRARSLLEAIQLHSSEGSEANDVIAAFMALNQDEKDALIAFLLTLRLPLQQGLTAGQ